MLMEKLDKKATIANIPIKTLLCLAILFLLLETGTINVEAQAGRRLADDEVSALEQILVKMGTSPKNLTLECGYKETINCTCVGEVCHVISLHLKDRNLPGRLPVELVNLEYLEDVDFTRNYLNGSLPKEWATMKHLTRISLTANRLSGKIPKEWGSFPNLTYLSLEANNFSGHVPSELGNLASLQDLILSSNNFVGTLPKSLANLKNLTALRINDNRFEGNIPEFIGNFSTKFKRLEICASGMTGPVPTAILKLEKLTDLRITDLKGNKTDFRSLASKELNNLVLRNLNLSGTIPTVVWNLTELDFLDISFNRVEGRLPKDNYVRIPKYTFLSGNNLTEDVPDKFLTSTAFIDLSYNNFTWSTSSCKDNIEDKINKYRSSRSKNQLSELLPCHDPPLSCPSFEQSLHINCGGGYEQIHTANGILSYQGDDNVIKDGTASNYIKNQWGFSSTGGFMDDKEKERESKYLVKMNNSARNFGNLPVLYTTARGSASSLTYFAFCLQNGTYNVKLHFAEIIFDDNVASSSLGRRIFDIFIQGNKVRADFDIKEKANGTGKNHTEDFNNISVTDNILEIRLYWAGKGTTCIPKRGYYGPLISAISICHSSKSHCEELHKSTSRTAVIVGVVTSISCLILVVIIFIIWRRRCGEKYNRERDLKGIDLQTGSFSLRQLRAATGNFDAANKIGEGGFGSVYKGQLSDGTVIAVKQLSSKSRQGNREFVNEIGMISGLQHPNLVKLYGCCIDGNQLLLVYEYMENNCLARALFGSETNSLKLDWPTRHKICVGIARGLAFLHEESVLKIVHRDIKATNILLDADLNAKISDFGLAKLHEEENTHISTRVAGTIGYMAPEYALWGYLTEKADVYSFGIVVLEIVSGKSNTNYRPKNECVCLLDYAFVLQRRNELLEIMDPTLGAEFNKGEAENIIKVALLCTDATPTLRPTMSEVVSMLEGQTMIKELISDPGLYDDDFRNDVRFKPLKDYYQNVRTTHSAGESQKFAESSTTSAKDLYPLINPESMTISSHDLYQINPDSINSSEIRSLVSHPSS